MRAPARQKNEKSIPPGLPPGLPPGGFCFFSRAYTREKVRSSSPEKGLLPQGLKCDFPLPFRSSPNLAASSGKNATAQSCKVWTPKRKGVEGRRAGAMRLPGMAAGRGLSGRSAQICGGPTARSRQIKAAAEVRLPLALRSAYLGRRGPLTSGGEVRRPRAARPSRAAENCGGPTARSRQIGLPAAVGGPRALAVGPPQPSAKPPSPRPTSPIAPSEALSPWHTSCVCCGATRPWRPGLFSRRSS